MVKDVLRVVGHLLDKRLDTVVVGLGHGLGLGIARGSAMSSRSFVMTWSEARTRTTTWYTGSGRVRSIYKTKDKEGKWE